VFTSSVLCTARGGVIRLLVLPVWARNTLRLDELDFGTLQRFDPTIEDADMAWRPTANGCLEIPDGETVLLRSFARGRFPCDFVIDMATGLDAASAHLANNPTADLAALFASTFPNCIQYCIDEFLAAVTLWEGLSPSVRARYSNAGRTPIGAWKVLVANTQMRDEGNP